MSDETLARSRCALRTTDDLKKVKAAMDKADFAVFVGFPSGWPHIETTHTIDPKTGAIKRGTRDGGDLAELAERLHYGDAHIPARPFLEDGLETHRAELKKLIKDQLAKLTSTGKANLDKIGTAAVGAINELVRSGYYRESVPNAPLTIKMKGSDVPLIDGENMIDNLHFVAFQNGRPVSEGGGKA